MLSLGKMDSKRMVNAGMVYIIVLVVMAFAAFSPVSCAQQVHIELLHAWDSFREPMVSEMLDKFMQENPNIKVTTRVTEAVGSTINEAFTLALAGNLAPDVVMLQSKHLISHASQGTLLSLDEFIARDGISKDIWVPSEIALGKWAGVLYGIPMRTGGEDNNILFYNRQIFSESGLNPEYAPATWDELLAYSKKLVRYNGNSITLNPINDLTQKAQIPGTVNWLYSGNGAYLSADGRKVAFNTPEVMDMMDWVYQFRARVYRNLGDDLMTNEDFYTGRSAMMFLGSQGFSYVWDYDPKFPLGAGPRPHVIGSNYIGANIGTWTYAIPATTKNPKAAWELVKWLTIHEESAGWFMRVQGRPSPVRQFNRNSYYLRSNPFTPVLAEILERVAPIPILPVHDEVGIPLRNAFRKVINGEAPSRSVVEQAAQISQAVLDQFWAKYDSRK